MKYVPEPGARTETSLNKEALHRVAEAMVVLFEVYEVDDVPTLRKAIGESLMSLLPAFSALSEIEKYNHVRARRGPYKKRKDNGGKSTFTSE